MTKPLPKPCAHCAAEAEVKSMDDGAWIGCSNRDCAHYDEARFYPSRADAIRAWNTRAPERP